MSTKKPDFSIVKGPSRDRLIDSLKYQYEDKAIEMEFEIIPENLDVSIKYKELKITTITFNDGSGHNFLLKGVVDADLAGSSIAVYSPYRFRAFYDARHRKGSIEFIKWHW